VRADAHHRARRASPRGRLLPAALFVDRFTKLGGIDRDRFATRLDGCRSFTDDAWAGYWRAFADEQLADAGAALERVGGPNVEQLLDRESEGVVDKARDVLSPAWQVFHRPLIGLGRVLRVRPPEHADAAVAVDALVKAMTYLFAASWPGWTPRRLAAYAESRRLFDVLLRALAPAMGPRRRGGSPSTWATMRSPARRSPGGTERSRTILVTNGLEGTIQEVALPAAAETGRRHRAVRDGDAGTFSYRKPVSWTPSATTEPSSTTCGPPEGRRRPDRDARPELRRHWSTRMAARDKRLKAVVSNGGLLPPRVQTGATFGMPRTCCGPCSRPPAPGIPRPGPHAEHPVAAHLYREIPIPILASTVTRTRSSRRRIRRPRPGRAAGELKAVPERRHCAMGHYDESTGYATGWLSRHLTTP